MRLFLVAATLMSVSTKVAPAQPSSGLIVGTVTHAEMGGELPYTSVLLPDAHREALADHHGRFLFRDVPAAPTLIRVRRVGFVPFDTILTVVAGETTFVRISLAPLPTRLQTVRVLGSSRVHLAAGCPPFRTENERLLVMSLLEEFAQNAEQYRMLVRTYPFWLHLTYAKVTRNLDGTVTREQPPNSPLIGIVLVASDRAAYQAGKVFRRMRGDDEVIVPELQDFADEGFMTHHCFAYAGDTTVDSTSFMRLEFAPVGTLTDPDIQGTAYLRASDYTLSRVDLRTTGVPDRYAKNYGSVTVHLAYRELLPGIVVLSHLESYLVPSLEERKRFPTVASRGEVQDFVNVRWLKGQP